MSRPIRNSDPSKIHLVSIRCEQAALLLSPDKNINDIIGGLLAKYQTEFNIIIYAYNFLSNHFHLIVQAPEGNLWRFMQGLNREIAKRVNKYRNREGHFWNRRYDDLEIMNVDDVLQGLVYVTCNAVSHGLVKHPKLWPGFNCYQQLLDGKDRKYYFTNYTKYKKAKLKSKVTGEKVDLENFKEEFTLRLTPIPGLDKYSYSKQAEIISETIESRVLELQAKRRKEGLGFLGVDKVRGQDPFSIPKNVKKSPRPPCYSKCAKTIREFIKDMRDRMSWYVQASKRFRLGNFKTQFPPFCFKPPLLYCT